MTYRRILNEIKKPNKRLAQRVLQCLVVAVRPLHVEELAEVLAVDFDDVEGIPMLKPHWRWEEQELALLSACSSLIAIVEAGGSRVVQFSHFSVKEFLTSPRLATAGGEVSQYHIDLKPAHTILAQACLGVLLQTQDDVEGHTYKDHPLAQYTAKHWTTHAQFGEVSSSLQKGMEYLFDEDKLHFKVWLTLYDIDTLPSYSAIKRSITSIPKSPATPLYYAALCGFYDLVKHLIPKNPQHVNANGGYYTRPLLAALAGEYFQMADLLRHNGADLHIRDPTNRHNLLHRAALHEDLKLVQKLIEYDADINCKDMHVCTPLLLVSTGRHFKDGTVLRLLLGHGADINARTENGWTPLYVASSGGALEVVRLLLEYGADLDVKNVYGMIALHNATQRGHDKVVKLLQEHGAK